MNKAYFYTETAFHHQGDMNYMLQLIDATKTCGASGVKFQVMTRTSDFISTKHKAYKDLDSYCFGLDQWRSIFAYTVQKGLDIIMMPLNLESFELLKEFEVKYLDIHSVSFYDEALLKEVRSSGRDIILGVGGRTLEEIKVKKDFFADKLKVLMVGFQSFPSKIEDVKIGKIAYLKQLFPSLSIGYADHSSFENEFAVKSNEYARLLGATMFEKHITLNEGEERVDFSAAIGQVKMSEVIKKIDFIEKYILTDEHVSFELTENEIVYRNRQLRCVASKKLEKNTVITEDMLLLKLIDDQTGSFNRKEQLLGKRMVNDLDPDAPIRVNDVN